MRRAQPKTSAHATRQKGLTLSREQRFAALEAIDPTQLSPAVGRRAWSNVVSLIKQVEWRSGSAPCRCYVATLAGAMNDRGGVSEDTVRRASKLAQRLGLLHVTSRTGRRGREANEWRIDWERVGALSPLDYERLGVPQPSAPARPLDETFSAGRDRAASSVSPKTSEQGAPQLVGGAPHFGRGSLQVVGTPSQSAGALIRNINVLTSNKKPPPTPSPIDSDWTEEVEELRRLGMFSAAAAVRAAIAAGCELAGWRRHRRFWNEHRARWRDPVAVLAHRLAALTPMLSPDEGWPKPDPSAAAAERVRTSGDLYDRQRFAKSHWRQADRAKQLTLLRRASVADPELLLRTNPGAAEQLAIAYIAPRLTPKRLSADGESSVSSNPSAPTTGGYQPSKALNDVDTKHG